METNNQITANSKLGVYLKQVDSKDKVIIINATNKYVNAKRTNGDTNTALNELLATFKQMEPKYGFTTFEENADVVALIDEFAACIEKGMAMLNSKTSYTCNFGSVAEANIWLAGQTNIILKKFNVATEGAGHKINNVIFEYTVSEQSTNVKYQVRYDTTTDNFVLPYDNWASSPTLVGYIHNGGNKYTVYYQHFGNESDNIKVELEYNLLNNKPNKYISIENVTSIPSNITK